MMYAVIESGGKQYRVTVGDRVRVESLRAEPGAEVKLDNVLLVADGDQLDIGSPYTGASVAAKVVEHGRGPKLRILKFRRRQNSRQRAGHRQNYTELEITSIGGQAAGAAAPRKAATAEKPAGKKKTKKAAPKAAEAPAKAKKTTKKVTKKTASKKTPAADQKAGKTTGRASGSGQDDDLTRLDGVGAVLAEKLNRAGVTSLAQIAEWTEDDIARIDEELNFKGRIQRDDWVGQARKLIKAG